MPVVRLGAQTGETHFRPLGLPTWEQAVVSPRTGFLALMAAQQNLRLPPLDDVEAGEPLTAYLHADRWLVACPDCVGDFQFAWRKGTQLFMCTNCWNRSAGGRWRRYEFPEDDDAIEQGVADVPRERRNWLPGWTAARASLEASSEREVRAGEFTEALRGARASKRREGRGR